MTALASAAAALVHSVADSLNAQDLDVYEPASNDLRLLKITNIPGALADLMISKNGTVTWEYRPYAGSPHDPHATAAIILSILAAGNTPAGTPPANPRPDMTLKDILHSAATTHGIRVTTIPYGQDRTPSQTSYCEIFVTNPSRPDRGTVLTAHDGGIWWTFHTTSSGNAGLDPADIASAIAQALTLPQATAATTTPHRAVPHP